MTNKKMTNAKITNEKKVAMPNNIDSDVKLEKDTVFQVQ